MSEKININNPSSGYNGYFPVGYPMLLHIFKPENKIIAASIINIIFTIMLLAGVWYMNFNSLGPLWSFILIIFLSINPPIFRYILTPGPDIGCTVLVALGAFLLLKTTVSENSGKKKKTLLLIVSGLIFGMAALWRYHAFVLCFAFLIRTVFISQNPLRHIIYILFGFFIVYSIQISVNISAGYGPFETSVSWTNVYMTMNGINWWHAPKDIPHSMLTIIMKNPLKYLIEYIKTIYDLIIYLIPSLMAILFVSKEREKKENIAIFIATSIYISGVALGSRSSGWRAEIPMVSFFLYSSVLVVKCGVETQMERFQYKNSMVMSSFAFLFIYIFFVGGYGIAENINFIMKIAKKNDIYQNIEKELVLAKMTNSKQAFSDDFDFYFPNTIPFTPYNSNWAKINLFGFSDKYPELSTDNLDTFIDDCRMNNIFYLILTPKSINLMKELHCLYIGECKYDDVVFEKEISGYKIFKIVN